MNLYAKLLERKDQPLRIGVIGAGKFGAMYIAQVPRTPGVHLVGIADLSPDNARKNLERVGWPKETYEASSLDAAIREKRTHLSEDWPALVAHPEIDIIIESTGNPPAAVEHVHRGALPSAPQPVQADVGDAAEVVAPQPQPALGIGLQAEHRSHQQEHGGGGPRLR